MRKRTSELEVEFFVFFTFFIEFFMKTLIKSTIGACGLMAAGELHVNATYAQHLH